MLEIIGFTLETLGTVLVAYMALRVHHRVWRERSVDKKVFSAMRAEQIAGGLGVVFILVGFFLQLASKFEL